jgi:hypothetical protein
MALANTLLSGTATIPATFRPYQLGHRLTPGCVSRAQTWADENRNHVFNSYMLKTDLAKWQLLSPIIGVWMPPKRAVQSQATVTYPFHYEAVSPALGHSIVEWSECGLSPYAPTASPGQPQSVHALVFGTGHAYYTGLYSLPWLASFPLAWLC